MKTAIIIPARFNSTRLHGKILLDIGGKPLIQRTFEACCQCELCNDIYIAVDDVKVEKICKQFTANVIMTSSNHISGTSRIAEAVQYIDADVIINVQGDEPFIDPKTIDQLILMLTSDDNVLIASAYNEIKTEEEVNNPNLVKVVITLNSDAIYFSRFPIPYNMDNQPLKPESFKKHIGIYGYKKVFLENFEKLQPSFLENSEKLEQLRFLENGYKIRMIKVDAFEKGIDTPDDLEWARRKYN
ncbi:MAG: 3-deoxy-manno-octulosonate cytidylyltransferase [Paludibacter sp.]|nr:3-deoxy-manno-octulosonate cytidylyltransferase [Paludibacter sp.]